MRSTLKYTLRLHDHIGSITRTYFEFRAPFFDQHQIDSDVRAHQAYVQDVLTDRAHYSDLTPDQKYLHDLGGLVSPVLSTYRLRLRLPRLKPRTGDIRASSRLEECCQQLAILAYNFRERIKAFAESTVDIVHETEERRETRTQVSNIIKEYDRKNQRILRFRNFVVLLRMHPPKRHLGHRNSSKIQKHYPYLRLYFVFAQPQLFRCVPMALLGRRPQILSNMY